tara:strand:- start:1201 stop:2358 length:1158 start_codon:yes stop_codon:yes gene_type:complete
MKTRKKILCITGTRADYPRIKSVLKEIDANQNLDLSLVVTGSHLLEEYGSTINEIKKDKFIIDAEVHMFDENYNTPKGMVKAVAKCIDGMSECLEKINPDLVLITVDRVETLASAVAVALMNFPIAHVQGGEVTGTIDESIRHAVTKLSHIHFPSTNDAATRIIKMGEDAKNVFTVGCPYIDIINSIKFKSKNDISKQYGLDKNKDFIIFTQHAVTTEFGSSLEQIKISIEALREFTDYLVIAFYSNTDMGGQEIISEINKEKNFVVIPNMDSADFLSLMNCAAVMVGNSSAAIREAPSFNLPAVNIGTRQNGRLRSLNILDVNHNIEEITNAIYKCLNDDDFKQEIKKHKNPYGDGNSAKKIVKIIEDIEINESLIQKRIAYEI